MRPLPLVTLFLTVRGAGRHVYLPSLWSEINPTAAVVKKQQQLLTHEAVAKIHQRARDHKTDSTTSRVRKNKKTAVYIVRIGRGSCFLSLVFFFFPLYCLFTVVVLSSSLPVVTQIRGHIAAPPPPFQLRHVPSFLSREEIIISQQSFLLFFIFFQIVKISPSTVRIELKDQRQKYSGDAHHRIVFFQPFHPSDVSRGTSTGIVPGMG